MSNHSPIQRGLHKITRICLLAFLKAGGFQLLNCVRKRKVLILAYHGFTNSKSSRHLQSSLFEQQIKFLKKHYNIITLDDFFSYKQGKGSIPKNSVIITIDDGYRNVYSQIFPILKKCAVPASLFLATGFIGTKKFQWADELRCLLGCAGVDKNEIELTISKLKRASAVEINVALKAAKENAKLSDCKTAKRDAEEYGFMNWTQVDKMANTKINFYPHGHNHFILSRLDAPTIKNELKMSLAAINKRFKNKNNYFAYPNGLARDFDERTIAVLKQQDIKLGLTMLPGYNDRNTNDYLLKRISMGELKDMNSFLIRINFPGLFL